MLEIKNITKTYKTEGFTQKALNKVSLSFRECEFASILGPSGSGKTTFLNIIGGLDKYDSGDLIINGISTKKYKDSNWDSYRNHRVGFVFQSYNLITHQSVLSNVRLALTLSGISKKEAIQRAKKALKDVGLEDHINKRPNQLSGGQMQRVAIARALVNDPDILLADEPTGALDSETSIQIMELLKNIAKKKLVIMVTHNPDLAKEYSSRIIELKDGKIVSDSNPYEEGKEKEEKEIRNKKSKKTTMSFFTALSLSFNNLMTKKGRTVLVSFAGSIGIIGIALILAVSTGFQNYVDHIQEDTLTSYPLTLAEEATDITGLLLSMQEGNKEKREKNTVKEQQYITKTFSNIKSNDLKSFDFYMKENYEKIEKDI
ncbi:MAG: ABC transporter ATP-binding protein, partial [Bacilli bacterium]|nr:ABC transporter ATP-binding protein [Bacilli bacterium]